MWMGKPVRITLREDLTRYDSRLVPGATGTLVPNWYTGAWGKNFNFGAVQFDDGPIIDMVLDNLEFDPEGIASIEADVADNVAILQRTVRNARVTRNSEGKFSRLTYEYNPKDSGLEEDFITTGTEFNKDAARTLEMFKEWGVKLQPDATPT